MSNPEFLRLAASNLDRRSLSSIVEALTPRKTRLLGASLEHLYAIATCSRGCRGGDHVVEAVVGRCFNHSLGSLRMVSDFMYDESLNLTRSIAEVTNLLFLFNADPTVLVAWRMASRGERIRKFSPFAVRKLLQERGAPLPLTEEAYRELCEVATHVTPETRPNSHDEHTERLGDVGGAFKRSGHARALDTLLLYCSLCSMTACNLLGLRDELDELHQLGEGVFEE